MNESYIFITLFTETEFSLIKENRKKLDLQLNKLLKDLFNDNEYEIDQIHDVISRK